MASKYSADDDLSARGHYREAMPTSFLLRSLHVEFDGCINGMSGRIESDVHVRLMRLCPPLR